MEAKKLEKISIEEYQKIERTSKQKYEYHDGYIFAMSGGSIPHGVIGGNIYAELRGRTRQEGKNCEAFSSDIKLYIQSEQSFVYPDAMVVCGERETSDMDPNAIINPIVIVEVLSKSTADYDRGDKFYKYRQIPSLKEYILIEQDKISIEIFSRQEKADLWKIKRISNLDKVLELSSIGIVIPLKEIYYNVSF